MMLHAPWRMACRSTSPRRSRPAWRAPTPSTRRPTKLISWVFIMDEKCAEARAAAVEALKRDEALAEAHWSMAAVKARCDWDWSGAELAAKRAIELNPSSA